MHNLVMAAVFVLVGYHTTGKGGLFIVYSKSGKCLLIVKKETTHTDP